MFFFGVCVIMKLEVGVVFIMNENLSKLKAFCDVSNYTGNNSNEYLYTVNCVDYFFFNKNMGLGNFLDGFTDGANDGGIDFVFSDGEKIYLIQGKSSPNISYNNIRDIFCKILETCNNLLNKNYLTYSIKLINKFLNLYESFQSEPDIEFVLFTNGELSNDDKNKLIELQNQSMFLDYTLNVYDKNDIESKVLNIDHGNMTVNESYLLLDSPKNYLEYQEGRGAIFTIKASSIKTLYNRFKDDGLFGYNLREHIKEKKVDSAIDETIKNQKNDFWYLNNGITIACSDYYKDGNKLKLWNFSIINGAQTTHKIGTSNLIDDDYDFGVVCKIIKSQESLNDDFIRKISEASNSQKPIKPRDLRANSREQQILQQKAMDNKPYSLSIEIKRGVKSKNYRNVESWKRVTNEEIGQLLLACNYQKPGTARSAKSDIFGKEKTYNLIFSYNKVRDYDYNMIYDLVRLSRYYEDFRIVYEKDMQSKINESRNDSDKLKYNNRNIVCQNGKFVILSLLFYFYKRHYLNIDSYSDKIFDNNLCGNLTLKYSHDDYHQKLNSFFTFAINVLSDTYDINQVNHNLTSHSNFFKTDSNYTDIILPTFEEKYNDEYDGQRIANYLKIFEN